MQRLLWLALILFVLPNLSFAMPKFLFDEFERELMWRVEHGTKYVWGGHDSEGADCSGLITDAAEDTGLFGIQRTTAKRMYEGKEGWGAVLGPVKEGHESHLDLVWFTFKKERPLGHIGVVFIKEKDIPMILHASSSAGKVVKVPPNKYMADHIIGFKRFIVGD